MIKEAKPIKFWGDPVPQLQRTTQFWAWFFWLIQKWYKNWAEVIKFDQRSQTHKILRWPISIITKNNIILSIKFFWVIQKWHQNWNFQKKKKNSPNLKKIKIDCRVVFTMHLIIKQCKVFQRFNTNLLAI